MRSALMLGCLLACGPDAGEGESASSTDRIVSSDAEPRPRLRSPAEAPDLAPDDPERVQVELTAAPHSFEVAGQAVEGWAYNAQVPGPTLRLTRGQILEVTLHNALTDPTTIHWHGLHVPFEMDGATWMHDPVQPGQSFTYSFIVDQVGTFWYHPHFDTARQVDLGLYGAIVVDDPDEPEVDLDVVAILDAWAEIDDRDDHHGLDGTSPLLTVNGARDPILEAPPGSVARIRWINAANLAYAGIRSEGMTVIAGDQGLLAAPRHGEVLLTPGERAETEHLLGEAVEILGDPWSLYGGRTPGPVQRLLTVEPSEVREAPQSPAWAFSGLPPTPDPLSTDLVYVLQGDPMTQDWRINGERFPDITPFHLDLDAEAILEVRNLSGSEHPFHLHGHAFEVLSRDGVAPPYREIVDTVNVRLFESLRLRLVADNPGSWMVHCHILPHADQGMMTILGVGDGPHEPHDHRGR